MIRWSVVTLLLGGLATVGVLALAARANDDAVGGAIAVVALLATAIGAVILWAGTLHPLQRAERANLALLGRAAPPSSRDASNWVLAVMVWFGLAAVIGSMLRAVGFRGASGAWIWVSWLVVGAAIFAIKRPLDSRGSE
jgi:hypothetical protein